MERIIKEIVARILAGEEPESNLFTHVARKYNRETTGTKRNFSKKRVLPYYLKTKSEDPDTWASWGIDEVLEKKLLKVLQVKPRRTSSGVATITVITKPMTCSSDCVYCPSDLRMPKSYLSDEPACQRAERNYFDPYLQIASRLRALTHMGHVTDKVELIILGGTWTDYTENYQRWFVAELFRALNADESEREAEAEQRRARYGSAGFTHDEDELRSFVAEKQEAVDAAELNYNEAFADLYGSSEKWQDLHTWQKASQSELEDEHLKNETSEHRVVGLVVETRPDALNLKSLKSIRSLGCTKIQVGIQSVNEDILTLNERKISLEKLQESFSLMRLFGFKIHAHYMVNLLGSTPESDIAEFKKFVSDEHFQPDEIKLYPCVLTENARLKKLYESGLWRPYSEQELLEVLVADTVNTPAFMRISRMIRDFSAHDVIAGNKKANLRQMVEAEIEKRGEQIREIRYREISGEETSAEELSLKQIEYETHSSTEHFLSWENVQGKIAGFLRLSLPKAEYLQGQKVPDEMLPVHEGDAMIREVHVYGKVASLDGEAQNAQHIGLGKQLVAEAVRIARESDYQNVKVISSVGTREYYRKLGFVDAGLYQDFHLR